tara:strand:- start:328 stop:870 length:543 start_codon:yes stop_codon:yes gene_type:complete
MGVKTSKTDPLRIAIIELDGCKVGLSLCPGKRQQSPVSGGSWDRSLHADLECISEAGFEIVVSLIEEHEFVNLGVTELQHGITEKYGMSWVGAPIPDYDIPNPRSYSGLNSVLDSLKEGQSVFVHCMGGLGRAGTIVSWLLTHYGLTSDEAIQEVRGVRPGAVENKKQEKWVESHSGIRL